MDEFEKFIAQYPKNLNGQFEMDFFGDTLKPDCIFFMNSRKYYVFFNLNSLRNMLDEKWNEIQNKYPKNMEDLKGPLEKFKSEKQNKIYLEERGIWKNITLKIKFWVGEEKYSDDVRDRAKAISYLLSQIDFREQSNNLTIAMIDSVDLKINFYSYEIFDTIHNEVTEINIKIENDEQISESLNILYDKYNALYESIDNDSNDNNKKILKIFLANEINVKLLIIEDSKLQEDSKIHEKMKSLRNKINDIIKVNIEKQSDETFFFGEKMFTFRVIKDIRNEKMVLINSVHIKEFYDQLLAIFLNLRDLLLQLDENDVEIKPEKKMEFIRKYLQKVENLENLKNGIEKEIVKKKSNMTKHGINIGKNCFETLQNLKKGQINDTFKIGDTIVDSYEQMVNEILDKSLLEKASELIKYKKEETIKLIKEFDLLNKLEFIEDKRFNAKEINGILISRQISDPKNPLTDLYSVYLIR